MSNITEWKMTEDGCGAYRAITGTDESAQFRVAFIEKTPRVRIVPWCGRDTDHLNWYAGPKGSGPNDEQSRDWCDAELSNRSYDEQGNKE